MSSVLPASTRSRKGTTSAQRVPLHRLRRKQAVLLHSACVMLVILVTRPTPAKSAIVASIRRMLVLQHVLRAERARIRQQRLLTHWICVSSVGVANTLQQRALIVELPARIAPVENTWMPWVEPRRAIVLRAKWENGQISLVLRIKQHAIPAKVAICRQKAAIPQRTASQYACLVTQAPMEIVRHVLQESLKIGRAHV